EGQADTYVLPLAFAAGDQAAHLRDHVPHAVVARCRAGDAEGVLFDALADPAFAEAVLRAIGRNQLLERGGATIQASHLSRLQEARARAAAPGAAKLGRAEQSNTWILSGTGLTLKVSRRVDEGVTPALEVGRSLPEAARFEHPAPVVGAVEFRRKRRAEPITL